MNDARQSFNMGLTRVLIEYVSSIIGNYVLKSVMRAGG